MLSVCFSICLLCEHCCFEFDRAGLKRPLHVKKLDRACFKMVPLLMPVHEHGTASDHSTVWMQLVNVPQ